MIDLHHDDHHHQTLHHHVSSCLSRGALDVLVWFYEVAPKLNQSIGLTVLHHSNCEGSEPVFLGLASHIDFTRLGLRTPLFAVFQFP